MSQATFVKVATPPTPAAGTVTLFVDNIAGHVSSVDETGAIIHYGNGSAISGTPYSFTGFDGTGSAYSIPGWLFDSATFGEDSDLTVNPPNPGGVTFVNLHHRQSELVLTANSENWNQTNLSLATNIATNGFNFGPTNGGVNGLTLGVNNNQAGGGNIGAYSHVSSFMNIGNGTDAITMRSFRGTDMNVNFQDKVTCGFSSGFGVRLDSTARTNTTINGYVAFQDFSNIYKLTAYTNFVSLNAGITITTDGINGVSVSPNIGTMVGPNGMTGYALSPNITTMGGAFSGFTDFTTIGTSSQGYNSMNLGPTLGTLTGSYTGISITPNVTACSGSTGIAIEMNGCPDPANRVALDCNNGKANFNNCKISGFNNIIATSGLGFDGGNIIGNQITVNSVVTGTDYVLNNFAGTMSVTAGSYTNGPAGLGISAVGFVGQLDGQNAGSTVDTVNFCLGGFSINGGSTGGTYTTVNHFNAIALPGGVLTITNEYAYKFSLPFGGVATNVWGLYMIPVCDNWLGGRLKVGGTAGVTDTATYNLQIEGSSQLGSAITDTVGFFGAAPVAQQTGGAAVATLLYTATEQGMINRMYSALRTFGLLS